MAVRPATAADDAAVADVVTRAFGGHGPTVAALVAELRVKGLGTELVDAAIVTARELGAPALFLEGDPGFYAGRGFEPATPRGFVRPPPRIPEPAFQVAVLDAHEPWMSGPLVYCDPFWTRDCVGLRDHGPA